jgi:hypothetical protein
MRVLLAGKRKLNSRSEHEQGSRLPKRDRPTPLGPMSNFGGWRRTLALVRKKGGKWRKVANSWSGSQFFKARDLFLLIAQDGASQGIEGLIQSREGWGLVVVWLVLEHSRT